MDKITAEYVLELLVASGNVTQEKVNDARAIAATVLGHDTALASAPGVARQPDALGFGCYLIDHCEGEVVSEELVQRWLAAMLKLPQYAAAPVQGAPAQQDAPDAVRELFGEHAKLIVAGNDYAYFELAYTRGTGWMAWLTDKPAQGEPGTAAYAKSRTVIARGQGDTPDEACADALAAMKAPQ